MAMTREQSRLSPEAEGEGMVGQGLLPCQHLSLSVHRLHNTSASLSTSAIPPLPMW